MSLGIRAVSTTLFDNKTWEASWVELVGRDPGLLGWLAEPCHGLGVVGHQRRRLTSPCPLPGADDRLLHLLGGAVVDAATLVVFRKDGGVALRRRRIGLAFPQLIELRG